MPTKYSDAFPTKEAEDHRRTQKKYQRAVNVAHGVFIGVGVAGVDMETAGIPLLAIRPGSYQALYLQLWALRLSEFKRCEISPSAV